MKSPSFTMIGGEYRPDKLTDRADISGRYLRAARKIIYERG